VAAYAQLSGAPITPQLVDTVLSDFVPHRQEIKPEEVIEAVCQLYNIPQQRLLSAERSREVALPRQIAMYLLHREAQCSLPQIGKLLGGRDHTTILYGCEKIEDLLERNEQLRRQVAQIRAQLFQKPTTSAVR